MDLKSGYPFWPLKNGLIQTYPPLTQDMACDVVVLGGGITGALAAHHLAEAGLDTVVLDKRDIGWGSTSATTALLQYEIDTSLCELIKMVGEDHAARAYLACRDAIAKIEALTHKLDDSSGFERRKSLYYASKRSDVKALQQEFAARRANGIRLDWLDAKDIEAAFGFKKPAALLSYDAAQVDAYRLTHALFRAAIVQGLRIFDRTTATKVLPEANGICVETDRGPSVQARKLVFATGYESQDYLKHGVAKLISTYALASEPVAGLSDALKEHLIWESARPYVYMRTTDDGRVIMGGEDEDFRDPIRRDRLIDRKANKLRDKFHKLFPQHQLDIAFTWAGTFGETKDGLAYIGQTPEWPHAYFALGYGGNGITYSILAAEIIRDAILGKQNEYADLFRFDRHG
jgi:glycine/D-amino acid oxidase-like deaminating enzyme